MSKPSKRTFGSDFRLFFVRGLVVLLPSVLTIWIVVQAYKFVDEKVAQPINRITRLAVIETVPWIIRKPEKQPAWYTVTDEEIATERADRAQKGLPAVEDGSLTVDIRRRDLRKWWEHHPPLDLIGLAVAVILFYLAGRILGGFVGRQMTGRIERLLTRLPVLKQVYPYVKQIVEFMLGEKQIEFNRVGVVEYPRKGIWAIGFMTGASIEQIQARSDRELVTVFIPSSPTPFTGYTITVAREEVIEVDLTVEEALRFTVSGGVLLPTRGGDENDASESPMSLARLVELGRLKAGRGGSEEEDQGRAPKRPENKDDPEGEDAVSRP